MRDNWLRDRRLAAVAVAGVSALAAAACLVGWTPSTAAADTLVAAADRAEIVLPSGVAQPARPGDTVPPGASVRTPVGGSATLLVVGRETYLDGSSQLRVLDGARQDLTQGSVMVDTRQAPELALSAAAADVRIAVNSIVRVDRGAVLRVADFAGAASITPKGRRASTTLSPLYQLQIAMGALPGPVTPLALIGDRWERALASDLIGEDSDLTSLATGLDGPGGAARSVLGVLPASLRTASPAQPGAPRSEETLAYALAAAERSGPILERYATVRTLRDQGGSWGVVARIVEADVSSVERVLERVLDPTGAAAAALANNPAGSGQQPGGAPAGGPQGGPSGPGGGTQGGATPGATQPPGSRPSAGPTPTPTGPVPGLIDTVAGALPTAMPTATPTPTATPRSSGPPALLPPVPSVLTSRLPLAALPKIIDPAVGPLSG